MSAAGKRILGGARRTVELLGLTPLLRPVWRQLSRWTQRWAHLMWRAGLLPSDPAKVRRVSVEKIVEVEVLPRYIPPDAPDIFVPIGQGLTVADSIHLPVVLFDDTLEPSADYEQMVCWVAEVQKVFHDFRPIFVTSNNDLAVYRRFGYMVEYVMNADRWALIEHESSWAQYRRDRLDRIVVFHRVRRTLPLVAAMEMRRRLISPLHVKVPG